MLRLLKKNPPLPDFGPAKDSDKPTTKLALVSGRVAEVPKAGDGGDGKPGKGKKGRGKGMPGDDFPTMGLLAPPRAKRYSLKEFAVRDLIGRGAFSEVSLARHIYEEQHYALKVYKKSEVASSVKILRLKSEIEILRVLKHPFILGLKATFQDPRRIYLMFEFCQGGELFTHLRNLGTFKEEFVRFYLAEVVLALGYMHEYGMVHRGVRPESVLLSSGGHVRLVGLDYAKRVTNGRTFTFCGAPDYVAPEILADKGYAESVDWWAFGVMAYELLFGYPPFFDKSPFLTYQKIAKGDFTFGLGGGSSKRPPPAHQMISKLLKVDRKKRLGCGTHRHKEVMNDRFFGENVDWLGIYNEQVVPPWVPELSGEADCRYLNVMSRLIDVDTAGEVEGVALKMFRDIDEGEKMLPPPLGS